MYARKTYSQGQLIINQLQTAYKELTMYINPHTHLIHSARYEISCVISIYAFCWGSKGNIGNLEFRRYCEHKKKAFVYNVICIGLHFVDKVNHYMVWLWSVWYKTISRFAELLEPAAHTQIYKKTEPIESYHKTHTNMDDKQTKRTVRKLLKYVRCNSSWNMFWASSNTCWITYNWFFWILY